MEWISTVDMNDDSSSTRNQREKQNNMEEPAGCLFLDLLQWCEILALISIEGVVYCLVPPR